MPFDVVVVRYSNCALLCERVRPAQRRILKAAVEDKERAFLLERMAGLYQSARSFPGLNDDRGLGQGRHRDVALREEVLLSAEMLLGIPNNWHLADDQVPIGNLLLELAIFRRIAFRDKRTQNCDRKTARGHGRCMRDRIDAARKTGYDREPVSNEEPRKLFGPLLPIGARLARANDSEAARGYEFPCALEIQQLDRVFRISQESAGNHRRRECGSQNA